MAVLRFSHSLLLAALSAWLICLALSTTHPGLLTALAATLLPGTLTHPLPTLSPTTNLNLIATLCFLAALACAFVAGAVYGMEAESESFTAIANSWDLEKGFNSIPQYTDEDASLALPTGDSMTGHVYYPSAFDTHRATADAAAERAFIACAKQHERDSMYRLPAPVWAPQPCHPFAGVNFAAASPRSQGSTSFHSASAGPPPTPRLAPSVPATETPFIPYMDAAERYFVLVQVEGLDLFTACLEEGEDMLVEALEML